MQFFMQPTIHNFLGAFTIEISRARILVKHVFDGFQIITSLGKIRQKPENPSSGN